MRISDWSSDVCSSDLGHTDPAWFVDNALLSDAASLLIVPDHYVFRMLYSQGVPLEEMGVQRADGGPVDSDPRKNWCRLAEHYQLLRGPLSRIWPDWVLAHIRLEERRVGKEWAIKLR